METMQGVARVASIHRIQNKGLYKRFSGEREVVYDKYNRLVSFVLESGSDLHRFLQLISIQRTCTACVSVLVRTRFEGVACIYAA